MDTEKAKIFLTVISEGNLSAAAQKLGYTASGISRAIASIEDELGIRLFVRGKKGAKISKDAEVFLPIMRELALQQERLLETAEKIKGNEEGTVTIGVSHGGYFKLMADQLKSYTVRYPGVKIRTLQATSTELLKALEKHEIDFAIMTYRSSGMNFYELRKTPLVACIPAGHPPDGKDVFPLSRFEREPFIAPYPDMDTDYHRALESSGIHPNIQYTTMDIYAAYCMVEAGLGVALLSELEIESWNGKVSVLKTDPELHCRIGIMYPKTENMTLAASRFLQDMIL